MSHVKRYTARVAVTLHHEVYVVARDELEAVESIKLGQVEAAAPNQEENSSIRIVQLELLDSAQSQGDE